MKNLFFAFCLLVSVLGKAQTSMYSGQMLVKSIAFDSAGATWFTVDRGGWLNGVIHDDGNKWTKYTKANGLLSDTVNSIEIDKEGNKWLATGRGVSKFDGEKWTTYTMKNGLAGNYVRDIAIDSKGNKWFATDRGLSKFDNIDWITYDSSNFLLNITSIMIDLAGNKWFCSAFSEGDKIIKI